mmetsp:Transcript_30314/g.97875  ORF Transcript_30314/g.97875 Transcript_30314/m.97875 type:complete len:238 (+) Transcript_30314:1475-2188(+)
MRAGRRLGRRRCERRVGPDGQAEDCEHPPDDGVDGHQPREREAGRSVGWRSSRRTVDRLEDDQYARGELVRARHARHGQRPVAREERRCGLHRDLHACAAEPKQEVAAHQAADGRGRQAVGECAGRHDQRRQRGGHPRPRVVEQDAGGQTPGLVCPRAGSVDEPKDELALRAVDVGVQRRCTAPANFRGDGFVGCTRLVAMARVGLYRSLAQQHHTHCRPAVDCPTGQGNHKDGTRE